MSTILGLKGRLRLLVLVFYLFVLCVCGPALLCGPAPVHATGPEVTAEAGEFGFRWAFGAMTGSGADRQLVAITEDTELKTGDQLRMLVELQKECFVYVIHHSAQNEVKLLFPYTLDLFAAEYGAGKKYYIPEGDAWFELDENVGRETFYLLASTKRLSGLEELLTRYGSADAAAKPDVAKEIVAEIFHLRKENRRLRAVPERPVIIGGAVRAVGKSQEAGLPDIASLAVEVTETGFYGRTFTIEHR